MKIDTEGTYTLRYTAEDECGNVTTEDRTVNAINITYSTVLFTDGTLIINEKSTDRDANIALHGAVTNEYIPFNPNGSTNAEKYIFTGIAYTSRPWTAESSSITAYEIGSDIMPFSTRGWFASSINCTRIDLTGLNTSRVTNMGYMFFNDASLTELDVSALDTSNVTKMDHMFDACSLLASLDVSNFSTSLVDDMNNMFDDCSSLTTLDVTAFDTQAVTNMNSMFRGCSSLAELDVSSFDTSRVTNMGYMFYLCRALATIFASNAFVVTQVTSSTSMFASMSTNLVGGAGTTWASSSSVPKDKTYAHIDGGTANPGFFTAKP